VVNELKVMSKGVKDAKPELINNSLNTSNPEKELIDWKSQVSNSLRAVIVTVSNDSRFTLTRDSCGLQGTWAVVPPEEIAPESFITFVAFTNSMMNELFFFNI
jgi:hypothetical protein